MYTYSLVVLLTLVSTNQASDYKGINTPFSLYRDRIIVNSRKRGCDFELSQNSDNEVHPPVLLTTSFDIIHPTVRCGSSKAVVTLRENQQFLIACPGETNRLARTGLQLNRARCLVKKRAVYSSDSYGCLAGNKETVRKSGNPCANGRGTLNQVGYLLTDADGEHFVTLYESCYDPVNVTVLYSKHTIVWRSVRFPLNYKPFSGRHFARKHLNIERAYDEQSETLAEILGSQSLAERYIIRVDDEYLTPSHLSPSEDFADVSSQDATWYHFNTAPQWEFIKNSNWRQLEAGVRLEATLGFRDFTVYTGTYGVLHLEDSTGMPRPVYLAFDSEGNGLLPVPKYFWKVIHDPVSQEAVAVIVINNPHMTQVNQDDIFCPDVCHKIAWITWNVANIPTGYTFCCTVKESRKVVDYAPILPDDVLLLKGLVPLSFSDWLADTLGIDLITPAKDLFLFLFGYVTTFLAFVYSCSTLLFHCVLIVFEFGGTFALVACYILVPIGIYFVIVKMLSFLSEYL